MFAGRTVTFDVGNCLVKNCDAGFKQAIGSVHKILTDEVSSCGTVNSKLLRPATAGNGLSLNEPLEPGTNWVTPHAGSEKRGFALLAPGPPDGFPFVNRFHRHAKTISCTRVVGLDRSESAARGSNQMSLSLWFTLLSKSNFNCHRKY